MKGQVCGKLSASGDSYDNLCTGYGKEKTKHLLANIICSHLSYIHENLCIDGCVFNMSPKFPLKVGALNQWLNEVE